MVFVGPYEHHSNELPWRESIADVVVIGEDADGHIDLADLERQLGRYAQRPLQIGSFSAASNVTGILTDTSAVAALLHAHGALSFWDYAAAGPYVPIRVARIRPGRRAITRTPSSCPRTSSPAARRPPACWSCAASWSATRSRPCPAAAPWRSSTRSATATSTTRSRGRRAARRPSSSRSGPGWSSPSSRRSAPT